MKKRVKFFQPIIDKREINSITSVLRSGWLTNGIKTIKFENQIKKFIGSKYAIAVNSCTNGLYAVLHAYNFKRGDEIITTPMTFISTIHNLYHYGLKIKLVDINLENLSFDNEILKKAISKKTKGILVNHYGGIPNNINEIIRVCKNKKLKIIEDAATVFGAKINNKMVGSNTKTVSVFSFYSNKIITTGEGGVITTSNKKIANKLRALISCGISKNPWQRSSSSGLSWKYDVKNIGFKFNFTDLQAAIGLEQLKKLPKIIKYRKILRKEYCKLLQSLEKTGKIKLFRNVKNVSFSEYIFPIFIHNNKRDNLIKFLKQKKIDTTVHYIPANKLSFYKKKFSRFNLDKTNLAFKGLLSLPFHNKLKKRDLKFIANQLNAFFKK
jgi:dTDP-4-amino-4,6-dideoxygalactose transaminase